MPGWKQKAPKSEGETALVLKPPVLHLPPCDNAVLVDEWKASKRSPKTQSDYEKDAARFLAFVGGKALNHVTLKDLEDYRDSLGHLKSASIARRVSAIKSLLTYGCTLYPAYFPVNVGAALRVERGQDTLAERILDEESTLGLFRDQRRATSDRYRERNDVLLRLLYKTAIRRSEVCRLCWKDVQPRGEQAQITVHGKGDKTRTILLEDAALARALLALRHGASADAPVFTSRKRNQKGEKRLSPDQVYQIVRKAAIRAGLEQKGQKGSHISPHWLRHAHASHALENGAPITLVRDTLGHSSLQVTSRYSHARPNASSGKYLKG
jgi:site-specific recombinase XerD